MSVEDREGRDRGVGDLDFDLWLLNQRRRISLTLGKHLARIDAAYDQHPADTPKHGQPWNPIEYDVERRS